MKKAFTLAETLVVLAIIGVLAAILLKAVKDLQPDREKIMFKKAYQLTERVVGELVNDESIYPYDPDAIGFYNTASADVEGTTTSYAGESKFCQFFARKLNTFSNAVWDGANKRCTFDTTDGISWIVPSNFSNATGAVVSSVSIMVDINGDKIPNTNADVHNRDQFNIIVDFDGKVSVASGSIEETFLKSHDPKRER